jgi:NADH-ubiquinone oxidoreductase chain 2
MSKAIPSINHNLPVNGFVKISSMVLIYCAYLSFNCLNSEIIGSGISIYGGLYHITNASQSIEIVLFIIGAFILVSFPNIQEINLSYLNKKLLLKENNNFDSSSLQSNSANQIANSNIIENVDYTISKENSINYSLIIIFNLIGASLLLSSYDLISMYLSIELQSFAVYVLSTMMRNSESSTSAGLKYFLLGGLSSCFILLGCGLVYSLTGLTNFESIFMFISSSDVNSIIQGFYLGIIFIFIGFLFKVSAAPLHN